MDRWPLGVALFAGGYLIGYVVALIRHHRGRVSITVVSDSEPPPDDARSK